jgi:YD repeat-containing protein
MKACLTSLALLTAVGFARGGSIETTTFAYDDAGRLISSYHTRGPTNAAIVFRYDLAGNRVARTGYGPALTNDLDGSGLNDIFELQYFHALGQNPAGDPDNDGLNNSNELALGGSPVAPDTDIDGQGDFDESIAGTGLGTATSYFRVADTRLQTTGLVRVSCQTRAGRTYQFQTSGRPDGLWTNIAAPYVAVTNGQYFEDRAYVSNVFYRVSVRFTPQDRSRG